MKKILIIEDNDDLRENTSEMLNLSGYEIICAANGKAGVEKALEVYPDIILCDIMMPGIDGYAVLQILQKNELLKEVPFIFLSAKSERSDFRKGMELGADDYLTKPFSANELLTAIETRLKKSTAELPVEGIQEELRLSFLGFLQGEIILQNRNTEFYNKNQSVYNEGNHAQYLFYIEKGTVKSAKRNELGKELITTIYTKGDFFGYIQLMDGSVYKERTVALEETELVLIPKSEFNTLIKNQDVATKFMTLLATTITGKEDQLINIAYNSLREKVATALLLMYKKVFKGDEKNVYLNFSRENMASLAGTATESLTRTLSDFKQEKIIDIKDGAVQILDKNKLVSMLQT